MYIHHDYGIKRQVWRININYQDIQLELLCKQGVDGFFYNFLYALIYNTKACNYMQPQAIIQIEN